MTLHMQDPEFDAAACFMCGMLSQGGHRSLAQRGEDLEHCLDLAEELIRRYHARKRGGPGPALEPRPVLRPRRKIVDRDDASLSDRLDARRRRQEEAEPNRRPTLH